MFNTDLHRNRSNWEYILVRQITSVTWVWPLPWISGKIPHLHQPQTRQKLLRHLQLWLVPAPQAFLPLKKQISGNFLVRFFSRWCMIFLSYTLWRMPKNANESLKASLRLWRVSGVGGKVFWGKSCDSEQLVCKKTLLAGDALVISQFFVESLELFSLPRHVEPTI